MPKWRTGSSATSERWSSADGQKNESTTWHNIVAWGKQAEVMKEYLSKGKQVYIEGRIANRSYDDRDGNKKYISEVVVQNFQFIGSRRDAEGGGGDSSSPPPPADMPQSDGGDDDLPF